MDNEKLNRYILLDEIRNLREQIATMKYDLIELRFEWDESCKLNPETQNVEVPVNVSSKIDGILRKYD